MRAGAPTDGILHPVSRARALFALLLIILLASPVVAAPAEHETDALPVVEAGFAMVKAGLQSFPISYSVTHFGPLVTLEPLVKAMGGELKVGPLGKSHELTLGDSVFVFGPDSAVVTSAEDIFAISQRPRIGLEGLQVPIDLLRTVYLDTQGFDFEWTADEKRLVILRQPSRDVPVEVDLVHLQGVTTVVLQFPLRPRYRIDRTEEGIEVHMIGDRLLLGSDRRLPPDRLVRDISISPSQLRLDLVPNTEVQDYVLTQPFRLVFDIYGGGRPAETEVVSPSRPQRTSGIRTIVVDPGHGGGDTGAIGPTGTVEKDLTMMLARALAARLERRLPVKVVLTRYEDAELPLDTRSALANQQKADLFLSLHINSVYDSKAHGAETYFLNMEASDEQAAQAAAEENRLVQGDPLYDLQLILWDLAQSHHLVESQKVASLIQDELNQELELVNRGVKQAPFRVLMGASMPAVLVELGFLSNPEEESRLQDPGYRSQLIDALVRAIIRYKATVENRPLPAEEALP
ncbi:MAG: N-acetylmuramoyl-L-alanine amidase [Thermoanaerobaculia bacterium]